MFSSVIHNDDVKFSRDMKCFLAHTPDGFKYRIIFIEIRSFFGIGNKIQYMQECAINLGSIIFNFNQ